MGDKLFFSKLVTKDLTAIDSNRRLFEGVLTVEMKDRQGEITVRDELMKVLPIWIARGGPITDTHSNRVVGQGINYQSTTVTDSDGQSYPAITIQGEIFKDYELDNEIWDSIKSGKYKGLSFGGATKSSRVPILQKDGSVAYSLKDLEQYEVAVCEEPAVPLALITQHNAIAKAMAGNTVDRGDGKMCIRCDKFKCYIEKDSKIKSYDSKSGDEFSDTSDKNKPYTDEQAEALENNRGEPQENGSTYHGTDKARSTGIPDINGPDGRDQIKINNKLPSPGLTHEGNDDLDYSQESQAKRSGYTFEGKARHSMDDGLYARKEEVGVDMEPGTDKVKDAKAVDEDNKEALEEAGLTEEKKLEYANDESEGPVRKIAPAAASVARIAGAAMTDGGDGEDPIPEFNNLDKGDTDNPGAPKYDKLNEAGEKVDNYGNKIPGVMSKKPKQQESSEAGSRFGTKIPGNHESLSDFRDREGKPQSKPMDEGQLRARASRVLGVKKPKHNAPYGNPAVRHGDPKKALDLLHMAFALKAGVGLDGVPKEKLGLRTEGVEESLSPGKVNPKKEHMEHGSVTDAAHSNHQATSYDPDMAEKWKADVLNKIGILQHGKLESQGKLTGGQQNRINHKREELGVKTGDIPSSKVGRRSSRDDTTMDKEMQNAVRYDPDVADKLKTGGCYNTDEVVREYCKENEESKKAIPHFIDDDGNTWYLDQGHTNKAESSNEWTGEPGGGNWGREPGITRDDESKSPQEAIQPKHVAGTTNEEGAEGLKKAAGDPQLEANNSEDGVNRKIRLDKDPNAEAFNKASTPVDGSNGGSGGVRSGAAYDNSQQDTGQKDNPREVKDEKYTGEEDSSTGADTPSKFNKSIILNMLNLELKKTFI